MNSIRKTTVAGMFYEQSENQLKKQILENFNHDMGPGSLPDEAGSDYRLLGVIVPHAGLVCSGPFAAHSYHAIIQDGLPDTLIMIGPNHSGFGPSIAIESSGEWQTPFGSIPLDETISLKIASHDLVKVDSQVLHQQENSLEVQLPFIKYIYDHYEKQCSIVPMVMSQQDLTRSKMLGEHIAHIMKEESKKLLIIASSDFSHEGYSYGRFPPQGLNADAYARKQDDLALDAIQQKNPELLMSTIQKNQISMCGFGPVISLLSTAQHFSASTVELLKYGTSHDTCSDSNTCVGYAALSVKK